MWYNEICQITAVTNDILSRMTERSKLNSKATKEMITRNYAERYIISADMQKNATIAISAKT